MLRPVVTLAAFGVVGILVWQLLWGLVLPLVAGLLGLVIKILFWAALITFAIWLFRRLTKTSESEAT